jgi:hypothetical protein
MERPAVVSAFGILNILFAVGRLAKVFLFIHTYNFALTHDPSLGLRIRAHAFYAFWYDWFIPISMLSFGLLLLSGIGLLRLKEWARKLAIAYGIFATLSGAAFAFTRFVFFVVPTVEKGIRSHGTWANVSIMTAILSTIGSAIQLTYPILLVIFMTRPAIAAAFRPASTPPAIPQG